MGPILVTNVLFIVRIYYIQENMFVCIRNNIMFLLNFAFNIDRNVRFNFQHDHNVKFTFLPNSVAGSNRSDTSINHINTGNGTNDLTMWCMY